MNGERFQPPEMRPVGRVIGSDEDYEDLGDPDRLRRLDLEQEADEEAERIKKEAEAAAQTQDFSTALEDNRDDAMAIVRSGMFKNARPTAYQTRTKPATKPTRKRA